MRKRPFSVEWHVAESDAEWEAIRADQHAASPSDPRGDLRRWLGTVMLLVAIGVGGWYWQHDQRPSETSPTANALAGSATALEVTAGITGTRQITATTVTRVVLPNRQELFTPDVVRMLEHPEEGIHAYQQTTGPLREMLTGALWGAERTLETAYFQLHFRQRDDQAVRAAAPQLDQLYVTLQENLGVVPQSAGGGTIPGKLVIQVSPAYQQTAAPYRTYDIDLDAPIVVSSPALYPAMGTWTPAELLTQSVALSLLDRFLTTAVEQYGFGTARDPVVNGVRLWQLWTLPLPLAAYRPTLVRWLYQDLPDAPADGAPPMPAGYTEFCTAHGLWMAHPAHLHIPLLCTEQDRSRYHLRAWRSQPPPTTLPWLNTPHYIDEEADHQGRTDTLVHPGAAIALATVVEYIVSMHGRAALPTLLHNVGRYDSWDDLIPAQFGVTATEFEAAWQASIP